jgi:hypothetical protein
VAGAPLYREHSSRVIGRLTSVELRTGHDGETELWGDAEIDLPSSESLEAFAGTGFSVSVVEYDRDYRGNEALVIAVDSVAFSSGPLAGFRKRIKRICPAYVTWYHQFATVPRAAIVLDAHDRMSFRTAHARSVAAAEMADAFTVLAESLGKDVASLLLRIRTPQGLETDIEIPLGQPETTETIRSGVEQLLAAAAPMGG